MNDFASIRSRFVRWCIAACIYHTIVAAGCIAMLYFLNGAVIIPEPDKAHGSALFGTAAILGLLGSLLYFSRKAYVYLITDKLGSTYDSLAQANATLSESELLARISARMYGYVLYLLLRPLAGIVIGPALLMIIVAGLSTIGKGEISSGLLSPLGSWVVLIFSFVAGYKSSDMFDYFSKLGERFIHARD